MNDAPFKIGDLVLIEMHAAGRKAPLLEKDEVVNVTTKRQDIKLKSGREFAKDGSQKGARPFNASWCYLRKWDESVWNAYVARAAAQVVASRARRLAQQVDFSEVDESDARTIYEILRKYKKPCEHRRYTASPNGRVRQCRDCFKSWDVEGEES